MIDLKKKGKENTMDNFSILLFFYPFLTQVNFILNVLFLFHQQKFLSPKLKINQHICNKFYDTSNYKFFFNIIIKK